MTATKEYQTLLQKAGYYKGVIDGDFGPLTLNASFKYQSAAQTKSIPKWLIWAAGELGQKEIFGDRENPRIVLYHTYTSLKADSDEVPWCASFVNAALAAGADINGTNSASAASFKTYGRDASPIELGAILLKKTNTGSMRHVFFNCGFFRDIVFGLGGNQSNMVNVLEYPVGSITEHRYPKSI